MSEQLVFDALKYRIDVDEEGTRCYYNSAGELHRDDGPAVEYEDGHVEWYQNGRLHRNHGPAAIWWNGTKEWYQNGQLHRIDGPAIEWASGRKDWYINGKRLTEHKFNQVVKTLCVN